LAFAQTIHMSASFLSPIAAGIILQESVSLNFTYSKILVCGFLGPVATPPPPVFISKFLMSFGLFWCQCQGLVSKCYCVALLSEK